MSCGISFVWKLADFNSTTIMLIEGSKKHKQETKEEKAREDHFATFDMEVLFGNSMNMARNTT